MNHLQSPQPQLTEVDEYCIPIFAIDPSLVNLGTTSAISNIKDDTLTVIVAETYYINKLVTPGGFGMGIRMREMDMVRNIIRQGVLIFDPDFVITELPVVNPRHPNIAAYAKQMEGISSIEFGMIDALKENPELRCQGTNIIIAHPGDMKQILGVHRSSGDKELITTGLWTLIKEGKLIMPTGITPDDLDEHSNDAIAMAYTKHHHLMNQVY